MAHPSDEAGLPPAWIPDQALEAFASLGERPEFRKHLEPLLRKRSRGLQRENANRGEREQDSRLMLIQNGQIRELEALLDYFANGREYLARRQQDARKGEIIRAGQQSGRNR